MIKGTKTCTLEQTEWPGILQTNATIGPFWSGMRVSGALDNRLKQGIQGQDEKETKNFVIAKR